MTEESATVALQSLSVADASEHSFPLTSSLPRTVTKSVLVDDSIQTDVVIQFFQDRLFVAVSQLQGKIGNYLLCQAQQSEITPKLVEYEVTHLLGAGRDDVVQTVYARQVLENLQQREGCTKSTMVLGLSLKAHSREMMKTIVDLVAQTYREAI